VTVRAQALRSGDRVAVVSPAGPADTERLELGMEMLRSWGFVPELGKHALARHGYLAGPDADRLTDLEWALGDPDIRAVIASRGGYGTQRIVDAPVWSRLRTAPKLLVGFSDITALHLAAWHEAGIASLYAPGASWDADRLGDAGATSLHSAMTSTRPVVIHGSAAEGGVATGPLLGGNLSLLAASVGAGLPSLRGAVLLVEEVDEAPYRIDRMLTQLRRSGSLDGIAGVAVGQMTNCSDEEAVAAVFSDRLGDLGVPVLSGLPIGHGPGQLTVPLGSEARVDVAAGILQVAAAVG
jgi:muramoyltetrapeptide carboxypeptidase